MAELKSKAGR